MSAASTDLAIDLHDVRKTYRGKVHALQGVEMQTHRGEIFGLLGPNGAGKSTLVKIMLSVVRPTRAKGTVLGARIGRKSILKRIGYLPEKHRFPEYLTGRQAIEFAGAMTGVKRAVRKARCSELLELVGMKDWGDRRISTYSKGMQQRVGLAAAMVNDPDLVVLDEPTDGVDPAGRRDIRDILLEFRRRGASVFLNSHLLSELEMVCDRVAIMVHGKVPAQGTIDELTKDSRRYEITLDGPAPDWAGELELAVQGTPEAAVLVASTAVATEVQGVLDRLRAEKRVIVAVKPVRESLEDLFMRYITDSRDGSILAPGAEMRVTPPTRPTKRGGE
ncbi:MAG: ABC transporter ATP-binding protein [Phycisphaerales bacterium]|nr:ABC transporter ATP-binding protein [Phycisphaerales bacterium]